MKMKIRMEYWSVGVRGGGKAQGQMTNDQGNPNAPRGSWCWPALCRPSEVPLCLDSPGKSAVAGDLAGAVHDAVVDLKMWAGFCAMRFWTAAVGTDSNVCRAAGRARAFGKSFTDFQLFPLASAVLIIKIILGASMPVREGSAVLGAGWAGFHGSSRLVTLNLA